MFNEIISSDYLILLLTIALGLLIGNLKIKGFSLGSSAVIIAALPIGYLYGLFEYDFKIPLVIQNMGLVLFIYTVGIESGPSFFDTLKKNGIKFISLGMMPTIVGGILTALVLMIFPSIGKDISIGIFTGSLTSTPGLAAAQEATGSDLATIGYSIAYPFGTVGIILFIKLFPKIFRIDIKKEEEKYLKEISSEAPELIEKRFIVENDYVIGKNLIQLNFRNKTKCNIPRIWKKEDNKILSSTPNVILEKGDIISVVGTEENLGLANAFIGKETNEEIPEQSTYKVKWFLITEKNIINRHLMHLRLKENYNAVVVRIRRAGIDLTPGKNSKFRFGDKVQISFKKGNLKGLERFLGNSMKQLNTFSFLPIMIGSVLGILVGFVPINFGSVEIKLGITGGVLMTAVLLSYKGKTGPIVWSLTGSGNMILREFGLLLFLAPVGISGGAKLDAVLSNYGLSIFLIGVFITIMVPIICTLIARYLYRNVNMISFMGILSAGMTSTPALGGVDSMTKLNAHKVAYAATYPFATIIVIFISQLLAIIL